MQAFARTKAMKFIDVFIYLQTDPREFSRPNIGHFLGWVSEAGFSFLDGIAVEFRNGTISESYKTQRFVNISCSHLSVY